MQSVQQRVGAIIALALLREDGEQVLAPGALEQGCAKAYGGRLAPLVAVGTQAAQLLRPVLRAEGPGQLALGGLQHNAHGRKLRPQARVESARNGAHLRRHLLLQDDDVAGVEESGPVPHVAYDALQGLCRRGGPGGPGSTRAKGFERIDAPLRHRDAVQLRRGLTPAGRLGLRRSAPLLLRPPYYLHSSGVAPSLRPPAAARSCRACD